MKKNLFLMIVVLFSSIAANAQTKSDEPKTTSKTLEFLNKDGRFLKKEFYDLGNVKGVKCQVLIITDLVQNEKVGCLRVETTYTSSYSNSSDDYIGTLDFDELDACVQSLNYIKENLLPSEPTIYTETEYKSRDNVKVGAFYNEKKKEWSAFFYTKGYTSRSAKFFDSENLSKLISYMNQAKEMIKEKTAK